MIKQKDLPVVVEDYEAIEQHNREAEELEEVPEFLQASAMHSLILMA